MSYMKKITLLFATSLFMLLLGVCTQGDLLIDEPVSSIKVYEYNTDILVNTIENEEIITELVKS